MPAAVRSAFDIAFWFLDTALESNERLQPAKLHRLMFFAQAYFLAAFKGRPLMPSVFIADKCGPIEPNIYVAFSNGRPNIDPDLFLPSEVEMFLGGIWRRFGHYSADRLSALAKDTLAYKQARKRGCDAEITPEEMRLSFTRAEKTPEDAQAAGPKIMRTQSGKPVTVRSWKPKAAHPKGD